MTDAKIMQCSHCGKQGVFYTRAQGTKNGDILQANNPHYDFQTIVTWRILECALCSEPILLQETVEYLFDLGRDRGVEISSAETVILYPRKTSKASMANVPPLIDKEYEDALKVREISIIACAVLARRTLEAILTYEKAEGKTLMEQINNLLKSERIPPLLADMAHLGRKIGNLAAHFAKEQVTEDDVTAMLDFVAAILEYLYDAPAKIAVVQERLKKTS